MTSANFLWLLGDFVSEYHHSKLIGQQTKEKQKGEGAQCSVHLKENPLWFHGPSWITDSQESWPDQLNPKQLIDTDPQEFAEERRNGPTVNLFTSTKQLQTVNQS